MNDYGVNALSKLSFTMIGFGLAFFFELLFACFGPLHRGTGEIPADDVEAAAYSAHDTVGFSTTIAPNFGDRVVNVPFENLI